MSRYQSAIFAGKPAAAMYLNFDIRDEDQLTTVLKEFAKKVDGDSILVGIGPTLTHALKTKSISIPNFPSYPSYPHGTPSTPTALWVWVRGSDRGVVMHQALRIKSQLEPAFHLIEALDAYPYKGGEQDLSEYTDGTANPRDTTQRNTCALIESDNPDIKDSSIVGVQNWEHLFDVMAKKTQAQMDDIMGRRLKDNSLFESPASSHVNRSDQDSCSPRATIWRNSMSWSIGVKGGLVFVAFGSSDYAFNQQMSRMAGGEDDIVDKILTISKPVTGCYYWCPPMNDDGTLNINALFK